MNRTPLAAIRGYAETLLDGRSKIRQQSAIRQIILAQASGQQ